MIQPNLEEDSSLEQNTDAGADNDDSKDHEPSEDLNTNENKSEGKLSRNNSIESKSVDTSCPASEISAPLNPDTNDTSETTDTTISAPEQTTTMEENDLSEGINHQS